MRSPAVRCLLLALATLLTYREVSSFSFAEYDDPEYVTENGHVQAGLSWQTLAWAATARDAANWHPVTWLSHALDYELFGPDPAGHHVTSLLIHVVNVLLLFLLLAKATGAAGRSWMVAALFALHPLNVESVAWVSERKTLLSMLFFLAAIAAYGWYARKPGWRRYTAVAALFALGLAAKPMVITLPCVLLLLDYWPLGRVRGWTTPSATFPVLQASPGRLAFEKLPLAALSAASAVITLIAQRGAINSFHDFALPVRLANSIYAYTQYLWKMAWPADLAALYPHPGTSLGWWKPALALLVLAALSSWAWRLRHSRPYAIVGWLWFLGTLVPMIGIVQVGAQAMADRYAYLPLIGIFVAVVWGAGDIAEANNINPRWQTAGCILLLGVLSFLSSRQAGYWRSTYDLWAHAAAVTKNNGVAEENLGMALYDLGRLEEALPHLREGARLSPANASVRANLAATLAQTGRLREAIPEYATMITLARDPAILAIAYADLGTVQRKLGNTDQACAMYELALAINPSQSASSVLSAKLSASGTPCKSPAIKPDTRGDKKSRRR